MAKCRNLCAHEAHCIRRENGRQRAPKVCGAFLSSRTSAGRSIRSVQEWPPAFRFFLRREKWPKVETCARTRPFVYDARTVVKRRRKCAGRSFLPAQVPGAPSVLYQHGRGRLAGLYLDRSGQNLQLVRARGPLYTTRNLVRKLVKFTLHSVRNVRPINLCHFDAGYIRIDSVVEMRTKSRADTPVKTTMPPWNSACPIDLWSF